MYSHKAMGMIGLVIVGDDKSNLDKIKKVKVYGKSKKLLKTLLKSIANFDLFILIKYYKYN